MIFISLCQDIRKSKGKNRKFINRLSAVHIFQKRIVIMEKTPNRPICQSIRCLCSEFLFYYYLLLLYYEVTLPVVIAIENGSGCCLACGLSVIYVRFPADRSDVERLSRCFFGALSTKQRSVISLVSL